MKKGREREEKMRREKKKEGGKTTLNYFTKQLRFNEMKESERIEKEQKEENQKFSFVGKNLKKQNT